MINTLNLITELCGEDRSKVDLICEKLDRNNQLLERMLDALIATRPNCERCAGHVAEMFTAGAAIPMAEPPQEAPQATESPKAETAERAEKQPSAVKRDDVQAEVVRLTRAGYRDAVRAIVKTYADCVSNLPEDKLHEVMEQLKKMEVEE